MSPATLIQQILTAVVELVRALPIGILRCPLTFAQTRQPQQAPD